METGYVNYFSPTLIIGKLHTLATVKGMKKELPQYSLTIKRWRQENNLSQEEISDQLGIKQQLWSEYERGFKKNLQPSFVTKFKKLSGIDLLAPQDKILPKTHSSEAEKLKAQIQGQENVIAELRNRIAFLEGLVKQLTANRTNPTEPRGKEKTRSQGRR